METKEERLKRFQENHPDEILLTLINSHLNHFLVNELDKANEHNLVDLLILGIHAAAETWAELLFNDASLVGFRKYLMYFVDGDKPGYKIF